mgnify:CR=1 FL=1
MDRNRPFSALPQSATEGNDSSSDDLESVQAITCLPWLCQSSVNDVINLQDEEQGRQSLTSERQSLASQRSSIGNQRDVSEPLLDYQRESEFRGSSASVISIIEQLPCSVAVYNAYIAFTRLPYRDDPGMAYDLVLSIFFALTFMGVWSVSRPQFIEANQALETSNYRWTPIDMVFVFTLAALSLTHRRLVVNAINYKNQFLPTERITLPKWRYSIDCLAMLLRISEGYKLYWVTAVSMYSCDTLNQHTWFIPILSGGMGAAFWNNDANERMNNLMNACKFADEQPILSVRQDELNQLRFELSVPTVFELVMSNEYYCRWQRSHVLTTNSTGFYAQLQSYYYSSVGAFYHLITVVDENDINLQDLMFALVTAISMIGFTIAMSQFAALMVAVVTGQCLDHEVSIHQDTRSLIVDWAVFAVVFFGNLLSHWLIKTNEIPKLNTDRDNDFRIPIHPMQQHFRRLFDTVLLFFHSLVIRSVPILLALDKMTGLSNKEISCRKFPEGLSYIFILSIIVSNAALDLVFPTDTLRQYAYRLTDQHRPSLLFQRDYNDDYAIVMLHNKFQPKTREDSDQSIENKKLYALEPIDVSNSPRPF